MAFDGAGSSGEPSTAVRENGESRGSGEAARKRRRRGRSRNGVYGVDGGGATHQPTARPPPAPAVVNGGGGLDSASASGANGEMISPGHARNAAQQRLLSRARALKGATALLPVSAEKQRIVEAVASSSVIVLVGETGSGKTTQIPQFLYQAGYGKNGIIAITQPRRVAASSIARRVSEEMGVELGGTVGYSVRFDDCTSSATRVKYMTDGMLLRELLNDKLLSRYSVIILDEAHERTLRTDILFGMTKSILQTRTDLKVIVMSATLDAERFSEYFNNADILNVPGRQFPVRIFQTASQQEDYLDAALVATLQVHVDQPPGDVLVFLTGQEEIESVEKMLRDHMWEIPKDGQQMLICPLFASLPAAQQMKVFAPAPPQTRKIILATNVAETSITISGIRYVIDTGMVKVRAFNAKLGIESLSVIPISKAAARQRTGRAGREAPGVCYRLYTEEGFRSLSENTEPEILRVNLANVLLTLKASGVEDVLNFDFLDPPPRAAIIRALEHLYALKALGNDGKITANGRKMAEFPVDPSLAKALLHAKDLGCTLEVIAIISMLSVESVFFTPQDKREEATEAKQMFVNHEGDHLTLWNVLRGYEAVHADREWCSAHFVSTRAMKNALDIRKQLSEFCEAQGISPTLSAGNETEPILRCFVHGFFQHAAVLQADGSYRTIGNKQVCHIHPSSVLFGKKLPLIMYHEMVQTSRQYMRNVSAISPLWMEQAGSHYFGLNSVTTTSS